MAIKMADIVARVTSQTQYSSLLAGDQFGFKSAKQYGAVGDGITDDSAAILSLISAVSSSTSKSLYFPTGVYKVDNVTLTSTHFNGYYLFGDNASFNGITKDIDQVGNTIGNLSDLNTTNKNSIVGAINELEAESVAGVLTTRGDIISHDSTGTIRVGIGTPLQYVVAGNTSDTTPIKYLNSPQKVMSSKGDMIYHTTDYALGRIPASTGAGVLGFNLTSGTPEFVTGNAFQSVYVNATTNGVEFAPSERSILDTKGSMLYASAANTLQKLSPLTGNAVLRYNYSSSAPEWVSVGSSSQGQILQVTNGLAAFRNKFTMEVITSTSGFVWNPPFSGIYNITITGGGGSGGSGYSTDQGKSGAGGGGGTAFLTTLLSSSESITITIGAGGVIPTTTNTQGNNGAASSFGSYATANGGTGGGSVGSPGSGGTATGGTLNLNGGSGAEQPFTSAQRTMGGASFWGLSQTTNADKPFGAGGSGGGDYTGGVKFNGRQGVCIITY